MRWLAVTARMLSLTFVVTLAVSVTGIGSCSASDREAVEPDAPKEAAPAPAQAQVKPDVPEEASPVPAQAQAEPDAPEEAAPVPAQAQVKPDAPEEAAPAPAQAQVKPDAPEEAAPAPAQAQVKPDAPEEAAPAPAQAQVKPDVSAGADASLPRSVPAVQASPIRLFGTVEFRTAIKNLPKWERVMDSERKNPSFTPAGLDTKSTSVRKRWKELKDKIADAPLREQVTRVNNFFNQWPYKSDREVWGVEDYWATPREFVERSGDCEDYAIAKYYALRDLGTPALILRVAAVKDTIRGIGHAVLVVYMENDAYVLDNLTNLVLSHSKLKHYVLQYSVNQESLWRHVKPKPAVVKK